MSPAARFKRALVTLLLELARVYGLTMSLNRGSADDVVKKNLRKIMLRAHPHKASGSEATAKRLNAAWECGSLHGRMDDGIHYFFNTDSPDPLNQE